MAGTRGSPVESSRGAFDTVSHASVHALDIKNAALLVHNPLPGAIGGVTISNGTNWITTVNPTLTGILTVPNEGLHLLDTNASHDLIIKPGSDLTVDRIFTFITGDVARTASFLGDLSITGNFTVGAATSITGGGTIALGGFTLTVPKTGTAVVGTGTATRIAEWVTDANTLQASTLIKSGAGVLTLSAAAAYTLTVPATGTAAMLNQSNSFTLINPLVTIAESWIGPSSTDGIYFKGGLVGIGDTTPGQKLDVTGVIRASSSIQANNGSVILGTVGGSTGVYGSGGLALLYWDGGAVAPALTWRNTGYVGIGVTDPDTLLELYKVGTQLKLSGGAADYATFAVAADGAMTITTVDADAALAHIILAPDGYVVSNARIGVGLTPTANMLGVSIESGLLTLKETTTPTADADYGKIYTKADNKLYCQTGDGVEHVVAFV